MSNTTAVEEIEAAIAKLTTERDAATTGRWVYSDDILAPTGFTANVTVNQWDVARCSGGDLDPQMGRRDDTAQANARLIETLHRTIDVQVSFLSAGLGWWKQWTPQQGLLRWHEECLDLARAVNGVNAS